MKFDPNALCYRMLEYYSENKGRVNPETGRTALVKFANNGSSRSSKTYDAIHFIVAMFDAHRGKNLYCAVFRDELVDCRDTTFKDFKECLAIMDIIDQCYIVEHPKPKITLWGNTIAFLGLPKGKDNKQFPRTDILFFNEALEINDKQAVNGLLMRCEMCAIFDWNPSLTEHWAFDMEREFNCLFTRTTYRDNKHLTDNVVSSIESYCPWDFSDYVYDDEAQRWAWRVPEADRKPNRQNIEQGTADRWHWLVYGEGVPSAREGVVLDVYEWLDEYPAEPMDETAYGLDFGFTNDPSVLVRVGRRGMDLYVEYLAYQPCPDPDMLFALVEPIMLEEKERLKRLAGGMMAEYILVSCETQDRYKDTQFVLSLNTSCSMKGYDWGFHKIKKPAIYTRVQVVKKFRLHVVRCKESTKEFNNYVYSVVDGRKTNIPVDKYNHGIDAMCYAVYDRFRHLVGAAGA